MKKNLLSALIISAACLTLAGCAEKESEEKESSIFEEQTDENAVKEKEESSDEKDDSAEEKDNSAEEKDNSAEEKDNSAEEKDNSAEEKDNSAEEKDNSAEEKDNSSEEKNDNTDEVSICDETTELDLSEDYTDQIRVAVERAEMETSSFEEEFKAMEKIEDHIASRINEDPSQMEMNAASFLYFQVWDTELNKLWNRFEENVDAQTKERVLADQRSWNSMKEDAALAALGPQDEGGSIYPSIYNGFMEESTKARCYFLAKEIAATTGADFSMPAKAVTGAYIDNEGTDSIYSSLAITEGWESGYNAKISLYRTGELDGSVEESNGGLSFTSYDDSVKGTISYGWDGAVFEVTEAGGDTIVSVGDRFEFPLVF